MLIRAVRGLPLSKMFTSRYFGLVAILSFFAVTTLTFTHHTYGAGSVVILPTIISEPSQELNVPSHTNTVVFNYSGGIVTMTSCNTQSCVWALDDAVQIDITRPNGTQVSQTFTSDTKDKMAENISAMFMVGNNTVKASLIDHFGPVRGNPRPLYIVESSTALLAPKPTVRTISNLKLKNGNLQTNTSRDPVNTLTGSFLYSHTDVNLEGRGPVPQFTRSYDSSETHAGALGPGWTHNYAIQLVRPDSTTEDIVVIGAQGRADRFTYSEGRYNPPAGIYTTLVKNSDGTYTASQSDQTIWRFDESGRLLRITDRHGNQSVLSYDSNGQLVSVSDPAARGSLNFSYDGAGRINSVTDWANRIVRYGYDASGRLNTSTDRENQATTYTYESSSSRLASIKDARNNIAVTNTYDAQGRVASQKDARGLATGQQTTFTYNSNADGTKTTVVIYPKTSANTSWSFVEEDSYDTLGRVTKRVSKPTATSTDWITHEYSYDSAGNLGALKDGRGNTITFCYDVNYTGTAVAGSRGNITRTIAPAPNVGGSVSVTLQSYDNKNNLTQKIAPKGVAAGTSTDCQTNLSAVVNSTYATDFAYDTTQTKLLSSTSRYTEPGAGLKTATTKFEYNDPANPGSVTKVVSPRGNTAAAPDYAYATTNTYYNNGTKAGLLASTTTPAGSTTTYDYDAAGRLSSMVDPKGNATGGVPAEHTWQYTWDNEDRPRLSKAPAPAPGQGQLVTENRYDAVGNKVVTIDANGQVMKYVYDERDSLQQVQQTPNVWTDPNAMPSGLLLTDYQYDDLGNMSRMIRAKGISGQERATDYKYDGLNRQTSETQYPSWPATTPTLVTNITYDKNGNKISLKDPNNKTTVYVYDNLNRQTNINYNSSVTPNVTYAYDLNNNRISMADSVNGTTTYVYDEQDRFTSVQSPGSKSVGYRYDLDGNRVKLIYTDNTAVSYKFDSANRLDSLTDWANRTTSYSYYPDGSIKAISFFNSTSNNFTYDNANRLTQVWNKETFNGANNTITQHNYTMDANGNRTRADEVLADGQWYARPITPSQQSNVINTYDRLNRLTKEVRTMQSPQDDEILEYKYDEVGNRLTEKVTVLPFSPDVTNYTYDKADRLLTTTGESSETFTSDANGNIIKRGDPFDYTMTYDQANRMILSDTKQHKYFYDGDGKRIKTQEAGPWGTYTNKDAFTYDINRKLPAMIQDNTHKYVWGIGLLYNESFNFAEQPGVYHFDGNGSMTSASAYPGPGEQPRLHTYEAYRAYGVQGYSNRSYEQPFKYTGEVKDEDSNAEYVYLRSRYYDPVIGRFTARDSYAGDMMQPQSLNRYSYVQNNPVNYTDPSGHIAIIPLILLTGTFMVTSLSDPQPLAEHANDGTISRSQYRTELAGALAIDAAGKFVPTSKISRLLVHPGNLGSKANFPNSLSPATVRNQIRIVNGLLKVNAGKAGDIINSLYMEPWIGSLYDQQQQKNSLYLTACTGLSFHPQKSKALQCK